MEHKEQNIDDLFRDALGDFAETPPPAAWDRLEQKLEAKPASGVSRPYRKYGYFGLIALLLLLSFSVVKNISGNSPARTGPLASNTSPNSGASTSARNSSASGSSTSTTAESGNTNSIDAKDNSTNNVDNQSNNNSEDNANDPSQHKNNFRKTQGKTVMYSSAPGLRRHHAGKRGESANDDDEEDANSTLSPAPVVYNSSGAPIKIQPADAKKDGAQTRPKDSVAVTPKPKTPAPMPIAEAKKKKEREKFDRFEFGVKGGYETGFDNDAAKKGVIAPYFQLNISPRLALMLQPAIKAASLSNRQIGNSQSFYKVNNDGTTSQADSGIIHFTDGSSDMMKRDYVYTESHDSIVKTSYIGGRYIELELPVLLKYRVGKKLSIYGGVNIIYSKLINVSEKTVTGAPIQESYDTTTFAYVGATAPTVSGLHINYTGTPISSYTGPQFPTTSTSQLRAGYMIGFSYEYSRRWLFDALLQQGRASSNVQAGYNVNTALSAPYLRLMLGYKLSK